MPTLAVGMWCSHVGVVVVLPPLELLKTWGVAVQLPPQRC